MGPFGRIRVADTGPAASFFLCLSEARAPDAWERNIAAFGAHAAGIVIARDGEQAALHEADRRKDEFIATLAHELRNPLTPLALGLELLRRSPGDETARRARDMMARQLSHLVRLVDDLLEVSRITRGRLELRRARVQVAALIAEAVEAARPLLDSVHHKLVVALPEAPLYVDVDSVRLVQVLYNLLSNAARYTPASGHVTITAHAEGGDVLVTVEDDGRGIAPEELERIFAMFERAGHDTAGLGIGLTLARHLVELHEGTLQAASDGLGRGARFTVRLALASPPESNAEPMHRPGLPARGLRFLIADDNREIAGCLATLVEEAGNVAHVVHDGAAAVAAAETFRPDVVLLDLGMPIMGGVAACGALRALPRGPALVIVALTGWGQARDRDATRAAGFDAHPVKPVTADDVLSLIATLHAARANVATADSQSKFA